MKILIAQELLRENLNRARIVARKAVIAQDLDKELRDNSFSRKVDPLSK